MKITTTGRVKRLALALAAGAALSGCAVYAPPYGYGPAYVGPPVSLDFSYHDYDYRGGHGHGRGWGHHHDWH